jgi:hypothetical protein
MPIAQFNLLDVGKGSEIIDISQKHLEKEKKELFEIIETWKSR